MSSSDGSLCASKAYHGSHSLYRLHSLTGVGFPELSRSYPICQRAIPFRQGTIGPVGLEVESIALGHPTPQSEEVVVSHGRDTISDATTLG